MNSGQGSEGVEEIRRRIKVSDFMDPEERPIIDVSSRPKLFAYIGSRFHILAKNGARPPLPELLTYAPDRKYQFSEKLDLYIRDLRKMPRLPPPQPPARGKSDVIDIAEYILVDDRAVKVPETVLQQPLEALVGHLTKGYDDSMSRVRVLFRWLTNQPIQRMSLLQSQPKSNSTLYQLWKLRNKRQRYSALFSLLCRFAGIPCVIIHGATKGTHYDIGERVDLQRHYGEWNAVLVEGEWRLVDALWGSCDTKDPGDGRGRYTCDDNFFFTDPKSLIFTHFAATPRWQLLETPKTLEGFEETACLKNRFFDLGMQILSHPLCEIQAPEGEIDILFGLSHRKGMSQKFNAYISHFNRPETKRYLSRGQSNRVPVFIHRLTESSVSVKVRFPDSGVFKLEIVGKQIDNSNLYREFDWVAIYKVFVDIPCDRHFPKMDSIGWGPPKEIGQIGLAPFNYTSGVVVAKNNQMKIRFKIVDRTIVQNMKFFFKMSSTFDTDFAITTVSDRFEVDANIMTFYIDIPPVGEYTLKMFARNVRGNLGGDTKGEINICNYLLISDVMHTDYQLGVLTEKTEFFDEPPPEIPPLNLFGSPEPRPSETADSIVSTSNVVMETNTDVKAPSPVIKRKEMSPPLDDVSVMEIPLVTTKPTEQPPPPSREPRLERRDVKPRTNNKVVPFGAGDDKDTKAPAPSSSSSSSKPTRPGSGITRKKSSDDMTFFKALNVVRKRLE